MIETQSAYDDIQKDDQYRRLMLEIEDLQRRMEEAQRALYTPNPKQLEFHNMGSYLRERMIFGANRSGKTLAGAQEAAFHTTGRYPEWWQGRTVPRENVGWVAGVSQELTRDVCQRYLCGDPSGLPESLGTGLIPKECIVDFRMGRGLANVIDTLVVRHIGGGNSTIKFKSYDQGRLRFQSAACNWAWADEECPYLIYKELLTRTNDGGQRPGELGFIYMTFTPLMGLTRTVKRFYPTVDDPDTMGMVILALEDTTHFSPEQVAAIEKSYDEHERRSRTLGLPHLGSGLVYDIAPDVYFVKAFPIPKDFFQIIALDPGSGGHPYGYAKCAVDRNDPSFPVFYVMDCRRTTNERESVSMQIIREMGGASPDEIPVTWPHDLGRTDRDSGKQLASKYRDPPNNLNMMALHATHPAGGYGLEAGIREIREAKVTGGFRVFDTCSLYREEVLSYHRVEGIINPENDHVLDAVRKGWMMQRHAEQPRNTLSMSHILGATTEGAGYDPHAGVMSEYEDGGYAGGEW